MLSGKKLSAILWAGAAGSLFVWWVMAGQAPHQEWLTIFPLAACILLGWDLIQKAAAESRRTNRK